MTDEEEIPLDGNTGDDLQKPHKHISLGFCRKQQVKQTIINEMIILVLTFSMFISFIQIQNTIISNQTILSLGCTSLVWYCH